jgi:hypothetical protein
LQPNVPWRTAYIPLDLDRQGAALIADQLGLPQPTITIVNPSSTHGHLLFELNRPVSSANNVAVRYLQAVRYGLFRAFGADSSYTGLLIQNPLCPRWLSLTSDIQYDLEDLDCALSPSFLIAERGPYGARRRQPDVESRNCNCFEYVRHFGYRRVARCSSQSELFSHLLTLCAQRNTTYSPPLPAWELRAIAKSVAGWCWTRREKLKRQRSGDGRRRGILGLTGSLSLHERRRKGAAPDPQDRHPPSNRASLVRVGKRGHSRGHRERSIRQPQQRSPLPSLDQVFRPKRS